MSKTNKELAVDVAIAYIHSIHSQVTSPHGQNGITLKTDTCCDIIKSVYKTLESLDSTNNE